jgi:Tfp pilus assembly protein PilN
VATRTGIELHPDGMRLVELHCGSRDPRADVRVRRFHTHAPADSDPPALTDTLRRIRTSLKMPRRASVVIWGLPSLQQVLRLPPARPADLEALALREARKDIAALDPDGAGAAVAVMPGAEVQIGTQRRREVSLVAASDAAVRERIQPLVRAGFVVEAVLTPALALAAMARGRREGVAGEASLYVAVGSRVTCLAIVRDGVLLFAREMPWGHATGPGEPLDVRLASELKRSILYFKQTFRAPVEAVVLCGDLPGLRSVAAPLGEALATRIETLDSLTGIDAAAVPEPADAFRADVAALRLAIVAAADQHPPANLLPAVIRRAQETRTELLRLGAGMAAGIVLSLAWYSYAGSAATHGNEEAARLERQVAVLEPEAARVEEVRRERAIAASRHAALSAFEAQGPRLARFLEAIAHAAPAPIVVTSIAADAEGADWRADVSGVAIAPDPATGQASVNEFLARLAESPYSGRMSHAPSFRVVSSGAARAGGAGKLPDGMSGVEFTARFRLAR